MGSSSVVEEKSIGGGDHISEQGSCGNTFLELDDEICSQNLKESDDESYAEPLIRCAWSGDFDLRYDESIYHRRIYSLNAFLSSKACQKVRDASTALEQVLHLEMLPTYSVFPNAFRQRGGPTDDDIALYFFPPLPLHEPLYDALIYEMISDDLGMQAFVHKSELLIFTSAQLPPQSQKFQGKYYLWGVFRGPTV